MSALVTLRYRVLNHLSEIYREAWKSWFLLPTCRASFFFLLLLFLRLPSSSFRQLAITLRTSGTGSRGKCQLKWSNLAPGAFGELHVSLGTHGPETYRELQVRLCTHRHKHMPKRTSNYLQESAPDRMSGWMPDRMPERMLE